VASAAARHPTNCAAARTGGQVRRDGCRRIPWAPPLPASPQLRGRGDACLGDGSSSNELRSREDRRTGASRQAASHPLGAPSPGLSPNFGGEVTRASATARHPTNCAAVGTMEMLPPRSRGKRGRKPALAVCIRTIGREAARVQRRALSMHPPAARLLAGAAAPRQAAWRAEAGGPARHRARAHAASGEKKTRSGSGTLAPWRLRRGGCILSKKIAMNSTMAAFGGGPGRLPRVGALRRRHPRGEDEARFPCVAGLTWRTMESPGRLTGRRKPLCGRGESGTM
jgi:hypothetical protein